MADLPSTSTPSSGSVLTTVLLVLAALLQLLTLWLVMVSGLVAPLWAIAVFGLLWIGSTVVLVRAARARHRWAPVVPVAFVLVWWGGLALGGAVLGWTA